MKQIFSLFSLIHKSYTQSYKSLFFLGNQLIKPTINQADNSDSQKFFIFNTTLIFSLNVFHFSALVHVTITIYSTKDIWISFNIPSSNGGDGKNQSP